MKTLLKLEYLAGLSFGIYLFSLLSFSWWLYPALFFIPDIGLVGYLINPSIGAISYNFTHHLGIAILLYILGHAFNIPLVEFAGTVLIGHLFFDRIFGYGLKFADGFNRTHLGDLN